MTRSIIFSALILTSATFAHAQEAVTLSADSATVSSKALSIEKEYSQNMQTEKTSMSYPSTLKMREELKVGAGLSVGGQLGLVGINGEFNFEDENSVVAGVGTGPGYNSIQLAYKHTYDGDYLAPYFTAGYSRWYNSRGHSDAWKDSNILDRVLTDSEKESGRFGTDFLTGSFGLQYNQLSGPFFGFSAYAEIVGLYEVKRAQLIPTGTVGTLYYF